MNRFLFQIVAILLLFVSFAAHSQQVINNPYNRKDTIKQKYVPKKLDVIYVEQDEDFSADLDEDEGTESEDDILYAGFDTSAIHYPKYDFSNKLDTTILVLINKKSVYVHPFKGKVTSQFGPRRRRYHYGIDVNLQTGDPVVAAFDGTVRIAKRNRTYGNLVVIRHENGLETFYAHLSAIEVIPEQKVKAGDLIGLGGNTGRSRGSHLHLETRYLGAAINPIDIIDFENFCLKRDTLFLTKDNFKHHQKYNRNDNRSLLASKGKTATKGKARGSSIASAKYYKIRKGDTLGSIAQRNGTTVKAICRLNGIKENKTLQIGKSLKVR